ncbi:MAG: methane/phenol/toluene monooxygenase beta subunit [Tardiphaga sp.]|nr:methane/phenol/toluene monooxygenase beta subunit [Tardiphaga sp.]
MNISAQHSQPQPHHSGAAGSAVFPGSDSRKYNYFEPKGRKATHYEDMTVDVQPDPERYLLQDWIISFPDGTPTYSKTWTKALSSNWHQFRAVDQEWERTHYQRQSTICGMVQGVIENARKSGAPKRFDKAWVKVLQDHLGAYKHVEFGLGTSLMQAQRYGYTQMVNNAILTNSSYKLRFAQDITLYLAEIGMDVEGFDASAGKAHWLEDPIWQGARRAVESIMGRAISSSSISPPTWYSSRSSRNCSAAASSCRWRPRRATSRRRRWCRRRRRTTNATSPIPSN